MAIISVIKRAILKYRRALLFSGLLALITGATLQLGTEQDLERLFGLVGEPSAWIALSLVVFHFLLEPARWSFYLSKQVKQNAEILFPQCFKIFSVTALTTYTLPLKLGIPIRMYLFKRILHLDLTQSLQLVTVDAIFVLGCWLLVSLPVAVLFIPSFQEFTGLIELLIILAGLGSVALVLILKTNKFQNLIARFSKLDWKALMGSPAALAIPIAFVLTDIASYGFRHMFLIEAMQIDIHWATLFWIGILATFVGIASTLPLGLGAYDATLVLLLASHAVPAETSILIAALNRILNFTVSLILGALASIGMGMDVEQMSNEIKAE